jgi:hypothetical protein
MGKESKVYKQEQLKFLLSQTMSVFKWINAFKPQNINTNDLQLPADLTALNSHSKNL